MASAATETEFWLFGYGSLIWKPPPHYDRRLPGYIEGYVRRFWQASEDHRGTPAAPGRVVTLITRAHWATLAAADAHPAAADARVWGAAYRIPPARVEEVRAYLDLREINGYSVERAEFHASPAPEAESGGEGGGGTIRTLVYIGLPSNPQFVGPQDPDALAAHVLRSRGPSGENREYLYMLEQALEELSPESGDEHVRDLARRCKVLERGLTLEGGDEVVRTDGQIETEAEIVN